MMPTIALILSILVAILLFGIPGGRTLLTLFILYTLPVYLILSSSNLNEHEKIIYALFISLGVIPSLAYWLSLTYTSLSVATVIVFFLLLGIGLFMNRKQHNH